MKARRVLKLLAIASGLTCGMALGACCPRNGNRAPLLSTTLTTTRLAGFAVWGEAVVDDELSVDIDMDAETVVVRYASEGDAIAYTYAITRVDESAWE